MKKLILILTLLSTPAFASCGYKPFKPGGYCSGEWVLICKNHRQHWICSEGF
ncbi:unnamed protein product [marine sediment metagenome]|uniref:Lipoprotein n=1 Tax=marine sediment metagenome TaxID=412755 RepID=X0TXD8_9ZZZZ